MAAQLAPSLRAAVNTNSCITLSLTAEFSNDRCVASRDDDRLDRTLCDISALAAEALDEIDMPAGATDMEAIGRALESIWNMADELRTRSLVAE